MAVGVISDSETCDLPDTGHMLVIVKGAASIKEDIVQHIALFKTIREYHAQSMRRNREI